MSAKAIMEVRADALLEEELNLKKELIKQWAFNHAEHCGVIIPPWPHAGECQWPLPAVISPSEAYLLLLSASGESFGLRL
jgi:hypothetical protein